MEKLIKIFILNLTASILLTGCGGKTSKEETRTDTLTYSMYKAESRSDYRNSKSDSTGTYCVIWYPNFKQGGDTASINKVLIADLIKEYKGNDLAVDPSSAAMLFVMRYDSLRRLDQNYTTYWKRDINIRVIYQKYPYVALKNEFSEYTGGAHGIYGTHYLNFDRQKNDLIKLSDLFTEEEIKKLTQDAEKIFRAQENLKEGEDYSNYFFDNGKFVLPENFSLREGGIVFHYGLYEIKPYVAGTTEIFVPIKY